MALTQENDGMWKVNTSLGGVYLLDFDQQKVKVLNQDRFSNSGFLKHEYFIETTWSTPPNNEWLDLLALSITTMGAPMEFRYGSSKQWLWSMTSEVTDYERIDHE